MQFAATVKIKRKDRAGRIHWETKLFVFENEQFEKFKFHYDPNTTVLLEVSAIDRLCPYNEAVDLCNHLAETPL